MERLRPSALTPAGCIPRHSHFQPYATLVLEGGYEEAGDQGRLIARPGHVLIHGPYSAHLDRILAKKTVVLDLPLQINCCALPAHGWIADPDMIVRLAEHDPVTAIGSLLGSVKSISRSMADMPDLLAQALVSASPPRLSQWASAMGMSREHVSRQFRSVYGISPVRFRAEAQARRAWKAVVAGDDSLSFIAADLGYADQAHMARSIKKHTGRTPGEWKRWSATAPLLATPSPPS